MRWWSLLNARNPLWRSAGWGMLGLAVAGTVVFTLKGPRLLRALSGEDLFTGSPMGTLGTVTEQLGNGRFLLAYQHILGDEDDLRLQGVKGRMEEPGTLWRLEAPAARRREGVWTLEGPMTVQAFPGEGREALGQGRMPDAGPALAWDKGTWHGLAPLTWEDRGLQTEGRWTLPAGWTRNPEGRFCVTRGPVLWQATEPGTLRRIQAERLWVTLGFQEGRMEQVRASLEGGTLEAGATEVQPERLRWLAPIRFRREDGWIGKAQEGVAPRPESGQSLDRVELRLLHAERSTPEGPEFLRAEGARWSEAGLRLEGNVVWEQSLDGQRLRLCAPRVLLREKAGSDLPAALPAGEAWAEASPVLTWGGRSLGGSRMEVRRSDRRWRVLGPVYGRSEHGTFRAGTGQGSPRRWTFDGPIQARLLNGALVEGERLLWEEEVWTFHGRPATWSRLRERLAGSRIQKRGDLVSFPEGIAGSLAAAEGNMSLRADRAEAKGNLLLLSGRVECAGAGWRLQAERISVTLGPDHAVRRIGAKGSVVLRGEMGEGRGEALELDPATRKGTWQGRVRGTAEVGS